MVEMKLVLKDDNGVTLCEWDDGDLSWAFVLLNEPHIWDGKLRTKGMLRGMLEAEGWI